ncbi:Uncharacterised protein [Mycobacteroides abscessus subsp. abscessus]|nr:Uncharacterised protein [Mycobacteroides abscessus subsp. abscessus]
MSTSRCRCSPVRTNATRNAGSSVRSHTAARSAARMCMTSSSVASSIRQATSGAAGMTCTSSPAWKRAAMFGCRSTTVCTASRSRSASSGPARVRSSCTAYRSASAPDCAAWKSRPCCSGVIGRMSATGRARSSSSICCWSRRAGAMSDGVRPPPPARTRAQMPVSASNHKRLRRVTCSWSSADGAHVQLACSCGPASVSTVPALSSTVCINGMGTAVARPVTSAEPSRPTCHSSSDNSEPPPRRPR